MVLAISIDRGSGERGRAFVEDARLRRSAAPVVARTASVLGTAGTLLSAVANLGCCGVGILGSAGALAALSAAMTPFASSWGYEALYASLALAMVGLGATARRAGTLWPPVVGLLGALALLLAFHEAWDVDVFASLVWGGSLALVIALGHATWAARRRCSARGEG